MPPIGRIVTLPDIQAPSVSVPQDIQELYQPRNVSAGGRAPGADTTPVTRTLSVFPPDVIPPRTAVQFQPYAQATTNVAGQVLQLWSFKVPQSSVLVIKALDLFVNTVVAATSLVFGIFVDGGPFQDYGNIPIFPLPGAGLSKSFNDQTWRFYENRTVTCQVINNDGGTHLVGAGAQGWYFNVAIDAIFNPGY
jgi:hypothetical protein